MSSFRDMITERTAEGRTDGQTLASVTFNAGQQLKSTLLLDETRNISAIQLC